MKRLGLTLATAALLLAGCGEPAHEAPSTRDGDNDYIDDSLFKPMSCKKATAAQLRIVNQGNAKKDKFLRLCAQATNYSPLCEQLIRPNPESLPVFRCTYGETQAHQLILPDESTWKHAFNAVKLIQELEQKGFRILLIYNWWRPEPYNKNVGGAPGRHPLGTSVDVRFNTNLEADMVFYELCNYKKKGRIRAIGHYGTNALHFGIGDSRANTWGKSCP